MATRYLLCIPFANTIRVLVETLMHYTNFLLQMFYFEASLFLASYDNEQQEITKKYKSILKMSQDIIWKGMGRLRVKIKKIKIIK